jgi:hypothetical protein
MEDKTVVGFPSPSGQRPDPEELIRRQHAEAARLASLAPGEWQLWVDGSAARPGVPKATLEASVERLLRAKGIARAQDR